MKRNKDVVSILCVHQGFELYGSDRIFISSIEAFRRSYPRAEINVILPRDGLLVDVIRRMGFRVSVEKMWVARKADGLFVNALKVLSFPWYVIRARRNIVRADYLYINTSVVFDYAIASRICNAAVVMHVHELPTGIALPIIRSVIVASASDLIYNSIATREAFAISAQRQIVVVNGVPDRRPEESALPFGHGTDQIRILMIGRINGWKGQDVLVQAMSLLPSEIRGRVHVKFVGLPYQDGPELDALREKIRRVNLECLVEFAGFVADPSAMYQWSDLVVVPSKKPEPFGLVAIEAMMHQRPVVAADHGGLKEIVQHGVNGLKFPPGDVVALKDALLAVISQPDKARDMGRHGREIFTMRFTDSIYKEAIVNATQTFWGADESQSG